jgi:FMN phosphatase YigB (HAD superfamily)
MEIVLGLDCDGVVLNYGPALLEFGRRKGLRIGCEWHEVDMYHMSMAFPDLTKDDIMALIEEFALDDAFGEISLMPGFLEALEALRDEFPGLKVVAVTSAGEEERTIKLRKRNLAPLGFDEVHVLPLSASKKDHLSQLPPGSVFVDDLKKHVDAAEEVGLQGVLVRQPYNSEDRHAHVMHDWMEGCRIISTLLHQGEARAKAA